MEEYAVRQGYGQRDFGAKKRCSMRISLVALLLGLQLFFFLPTSYADILPDGYKNVKYGIRIENIKDYPDYLFILHLKGSGGWSGYVVLNQGETFSVFWPSPGMLHPRIYAIKKDNFHENEISKIKRRNVERRMKNLTSAGHTSVQDELQINNYFKNNKNLISSKIAIEPVRIVKEDDPREAIVAVLKIDSIRPDSLKITRVKTQGIYADNERNKATKNAFDVLWLHFSAHFGQSFRF